MLEKSVNIKNLNFPSNIKNLINFLSTKDIYLIGGFIRDLLLGHISYDLDFIILDKTTEELGKEILTNFQGHYFLLDKETKTTRFVLDDKNCKNYTFDFTSVLRSNLEQDFNRRDFTINALAIDLKHPEEIIDRFNGLEDLKQKTIRAIRLENFLDDPLRLLRAFRFAALIKGQIEDGTKLYIKNCCKDEVASPLQKVSIERVSYELWKILDCDFSYPYIVELSETGLLEKIFSELTPMRKVTPNNYHHLWLYDHSLELVKILEKHFNKIPDWARDILNKPVGQALNPTKKAAVKLACLLHDIGKPNTWEIKNVDSEEKHTFYGHDKVGAEITKQICERLKFSNLITDILTKLVRYHLRPFQLSQEGQQITNKALFRFFRNLSEDTVPLLLLALADLQATQGPKINKQDIISGEKLILFLFDEYKKYETYETEKIKKPKLLNGNEIMTITSLKPSPVLGKIVKELDELVATGEIKTKEEAIKWVKNTCNL